MVDLTEMAVQLYRRYLGDPHNAADNEIHALLTGDAAVAVVEGSLCQSAVLGGDENLGEAWWEHVRENGANVFNTPLTSIECSSARAALASATGLSLAGKRAAVFLTGHNIGAVQDLLFSASGRHLPLVMHLTNLTMSGHGIAPGSGHEGYHLSSDSGCFTLFAENVQQVADFTIIARQVAETVLIPGLVVMDADETARSAQDVTILNPRQIVDFIGPADGEIAAPTEAQRLLFGETRLAVPRWHDVDRPAAAGAYFDAPSYAMGAAGTAVFFEEALDAALESAFARFAEISGRRYNCVSSCNLDRADTVLVLQGASCEVAAAACRGMHRTGVVGITSLRPFPAQFLRQSLEGKTNVIVLERLSPAPGLQPPLLTEIHQSLMRATAAPGARGQSLSVLHSAVYGVGGAPLRTADLALIPSHLRDTSPGTLHLGIDFEADTSHPKRQVLTHELRRAYSDIVNAGLRATDVPRDIAQDGTVSVAVQAGRGVRHTELARDTAHILYDIMGGTVRSRSGRAIAESLTHSTTEIVDPGDDATLDVACVAIADIPTDPIDTAVLNRLRKGGTIVVSAGSPEQLADVFPAGLRKIAIGKSIRVCIAPASTHHINDALLGALFCTIVTRGLAPLKVRKVVSIRDDMLRLQDDGDRESRMTAFSSGLNDSEFLELDALPESDTDARMDAGMATPIALQQLAATDEQFDSLPRFWNQTGIMYQNNQVESMTPDPYLATGTIAPLSAIFRSHRHERSMIPNIDAERCTGCGRCWTGCPDSALAPVVIGPTALIDHGIRLSGGDALRQLANQLATRIMNETRRQNVGTCAEDMLRQAYAWLADKLEQTPERQQAFEEALGQVCDEIGPLPLCTAATYFERAENARKDGGEFLALVLNPDTCKNCGLCEEVCDEAAIKLVPQLDTDLAKAQQIWNIWAATPDTQSETIERVLASSELDSVSAINLSRYCLLSMAGGDGAEPGSGEKIALRMVLSTTEFRQQPIVQGFVDELASTSGAVVDEIQEILAMNLPEEELDILSKSVDSIRAPLVELSELARTVETSVHASPVDTARLTRLLSLAKQLSDQHWHLTSGRQGLGRARFGLTVAPGTVGRWASTFPYNSFQAPVVLDFSDETPHIAAGLLEGHLRDTCESIGLMRQARLEIDRPAGVEFERASLAQLTWQDLSAPERRICPPMLVVGNDGAFGGEGLANVLWSLSSDLPIKIISLVNLDLGIAQTHQTQDPRSNMGLVAIAGRSAFVAQTCIGDPEHLYRTVTQALEYPGPALIRIHTPSPARHGFETRHTIERSREAVRSRAFPLFSYDPDQEGVHGTRLDLSGNENVAGCWSDDEMPFTVAHWAATQGRFSHHFTEMPDDGVSAVELHEFLGLDDRGRRDKVAYVTMASEDVTTRLIVDEHMVRATEAAMDSWRVLQELAGIVTPFTSLVEKAVRDELQSEHEAEIAAVREDYERQIRELDASIRSDVAGRVRNQLLRLVQSGSLDTKT